MHNTSYQSYGECWKKEPLIFMGFGNDVNKCKKNAEEEHDEDLHSAMLKADQAHLLNTNEHGNDDQERKERKKTYLDKMNGKVREMLSEGEKE